MHATSRKLHRRLRARALVARVFCAFTLCAAVAPSIAGAAEPSAAAASKAFTDALKLFDKGDFAGALPLFREALEATGSPNARLYVARCLRETGKLPEAYEELGATVRDAAARAETEAKYVETRDAAAAERAVLERRVGRLIVAIANAPAGVEVTLNGAPLDASRLGTPIAVNPGSVKVTATTPGGATVDREETVPAGETRTLALALPDSDGVTPPPPAPDTPPDVAPSRSGGGVRTAGFVVAGVGVAGMALFGVTAVLANNKFSTLETECGGTRCTDEKYADTVDSGKTLDLLSTIGLIGGIACITGGAAMILFGGPSDEPGTSAAVSVTPGGAALRVRTTF